MKVLIGIQARSASSRLPGKIYQTIGPKTLLQWVYEACREAERLARARQIECVTAVLGPDIDSALEDYCSSMSFELIQPPFAPENDLIHRYKAAAKVLDCNYVVRITSD